MGVFRNIPEVPRGPQGVQCQTFFSDKVRVKEENGDPFLLRVSSGPMGRFYPQIRQWIEGSC